MLKKVRTLAVVRHERQGRCYCVQLCSTGSRLETITPWLNTYLSEVKQRIQHRTSQIRWVVDILEHMSPTRDGERKTMEQRLERWRDDLEEAYREVQQMARKRAAP